MIAKQKRMLRRICRNYYLVENYEKAIADEEKKWELHHRRETDEMKSRQQLIDEGKYFDVSPEELIFLTVKEHRRIHSGNIKGAKWLTDGNKFIRSQNTVDGFVECSPLKWKKHSEKHSAKLRKKLAEYNDNCKGKFWWNDGVINKRSKEQPGPNFVRGKLKFNK